jgi:predicted GNAT superfamily acetyltransferase
MGWYQKLNRYFPEEEMKKKEQMDALIKENPHYKKEESDQYLILYGEYDEFIFVDYILVDKRARGQGIGKTVLEELKRKQKSIVLEVEPIDKDDPDTVKRERFYQANGFHKAADIEYYRDVGETAPDLNQMELYYWTPRNNISEKDIHGYMIKVYDDIHHFNYEEYFDREIPVPEELVQLRRDDRSVNDVEHRDQQ